MADIQIMMLAIIQQQDADQAIEALTRAGLRVTVISSVGSFLRQGNVTLLLGLARTEVALAIQHLSTQCSQRTRFINAAPLAPAAGLDHTITPIEVQVGGAIIFTFPLVQHTRIQEHHTEHIFEPHEEDERSMVAKLLFVVLPQDLVTPILNDLNRAQYRATLVSTTGGFLHKGNAMLMIGVESTQTGTVLTLIEKSYTTQKKIRPDQTINIFVLDAEQYIGSLGRPRENMSR